MCCDLIVIVTDIEYNDGIVSSLIFRSDMSECLLSAKSGTGIHVMSSEMRDRLQSPLFKLPLPELLLFSSPSKSRGISVISSLSQSKGPRHESRGLSSPWRLSPPATLLSVDP